MCVCVCVCMRACVRACVLFRVELISRHEDQLTAITRLCKREMRLLMDFDNGTMVRTQPVSCTRLTLHRFNMLWICCGHFDGSTENAGLEYDGPNSRAGKCSRAVWSAKFQSCIFHPVFRWSIIFQSCIFSRPISICCTTSCTYAQQIEPVESEPYYAIIIIIIVIMFV